MTGSTPRVSVVVPSFDNARYIEAAIASILAQTYRDFELIISDHSSTDGTWELLQRFADDPRVQLRQQPSGGGAPANWSAVTERAGGELLKLVCGDDLLYPTALADQVAAFDEHPEAVLVAAQRDIVDANGAPVIRSRGLKGLSGLTPGDVAFRRSIRAGTNIFGEPVCVLMRRNAFQQAGGWDARFPYLLDQASYLRVLRHGPMVALRRSLAAFRVSDQQWSVALARQQSAHARAFHASVQQEHPGLLRPGDQLLGDLRARGAALGRRGVYLWLRYRKGHATADSARRTADVDRLTK